MKFSTTIPLFALALSAAASVHEPTTLVERDLAAISQIVQKIQSGTADLDQAIKSFSGDASNMLSKSQALLSAIKSGTSTVEGIPELTMTDAASVAGSVQSLQSAIDGVVSDIIAKKSSIVAAGAGADTYKTLVAQKAAAEGLAAAIASKVPEALKSTATQLSGGVAASLQKAISAFQDSSSSSGSSSSSSSGGKPDVGPGSGSPPGYGSGTTQPKPNTPAGVYKPSGTSGSLKPAMYTGAAVANGVGSSVAGFAAIAAAALAL